MKVLGLLSIGFALIVLLVTRIFQLDINRLEFPTSLQTKKWNNIVERKADLLSIDISRELKLQDWATLGIDGSVKNYNYSTQLQPGYVSNINLGNLKKLKGIEDSKLSDKNGKMFVNEYANIVNCSDVVYNNTLEYYKFPNKLETDFKNVRQLVLNADDANAMAYSKSDEKLMSEDEIITKRWYSFGSAPVWLESENCYVSYTRVIYSTYNDRGWPYISIIYGQAYDKDWNELQGKRILFRDSKMPEYVKTEVMKLKEEINDIKACEKFENDKMAYESCLGKEEDRIQGKIDKIYDKFAVTYPTTFTIPFEIESIWNGPEDPHVILKKDSSGEEPVVLFNLKVGKPKKMFALMPHRKTDSLVEFDIENGKLRGTEKNWAPFFHPNTDFSKDNAVGFIYFIYDFNPVEILRCSLFSGHCTFIFQASTFDMTRGGTHIFRGATQFVPLPEPLPQVKDTNMWLGFIKEHIDRCGCGEKIYRPVLALLIEKKGIYHFELLTPNIDFNESVMNWNLKDYNCNQANVLSPSSIANWYITSQDPETKKFEDYLALTISEADAISKVVYVKGVLNYILGIYRDMDISDTLENGVQGKSVIEKTSQCVFDSAIAYCKSYGEAHHDSFPKHLRDY